MIFRIQFQIFGTLSTKVILGLNKKYVCLYFCMINDAHQSVKCHVYVRKSLNHWKVWLVKWLNFFHLDESVDWYSGICICGHRQNRCEVMWDLRSRADITIILKRNDEILHCFMHWFLMLTQPGFPIIASAIITWICIWNDCGLIMSYDADVCQY